MSFDVEMKYRGEWEPWILEAAEVLRLRLGMSKENAIDLVLKSITPAATSLSQEQLVNSIVAVAEYIHRENQKKAEREFRDKLKREKMSKRVRDFFGGRNHTQQPLHRERERLKRGHKKFRTPGSNQPRFGGF